MAQISIGEAAKYLGVSRDTLRRWEKRGKLTSLRSPTNRRYYTKEILDNLLKSKDVPEKSAKKTEKFAVSSFNIESLRLVIYALLAVFLTFLIGLVLLNLVG